METRANYVAVGLFTLVALLAAFVFVYWVGRFDRGEDLIALDVRIKGSVSGLTTSSNVLFNGIRVGRVTGLSLDRDDPRFVIVNTEINSQTPVRADTRATIGIQGLSGGAYIQLEGGTPEAVALLQSPVEGGKSPFLQGEPAALSDIIARVNIITERVETVMETLEQFVEVNNKSLTATITNAETFSKALADNSDGVNRFLSSAGDVASSLESLSEKLDGTITQAEKIVLAVDPESVSKTLQNVESFSQSLSDQREVVREVAQSMKDAGTQLTTFTENLNKTLAKVDGVVDAVNTEQMTKAIDSIATATERADKLLAAIDSAKVAKAIDDVSALASDTRGLVSGIEPESLRTLVSNLTGASESVSKLVSSIDAAEINKTVSNLSSAAEGVQKTVEGAQKTVEGAQKVVSDVGKVTETLGARSQDIDQVVTDIAELSSRLNESSKKVDGVLTRLDDLLGSDAANGVFAEARKTLLAFRETASNLDVRIDSVANGINRFTARGLSDTQGLIRDVRQSIQRIDRVIRNIESNPTSLLSGSGSSGIPESSGRRPRR